MSMCFSTDCGGSATLVQARELFDWTGACFAGYSASTTPGGQYDNNDNVAAS